MAGRLIVALRFAKKLIDKQMGAANYIERIALISAASYSRYPRTERLAENSPSALRPSPFALELRPIGE